tara:strand:- start:1273 stop:1584 length:312 start_codon:yes stop_codon:yes gene_type:complete
MSDVKYDSVLVGYAEEPRYFEENLSSWSVRIKDTELKEMIDKYATRRNDAGEGGNVYFKLFMSKSGKACCSVFDPNSEGAKEKRAAKLAAAEAAATVTDDMPF